MREPSDGKGPIEPPERDHPLDKVRAVVSAVVELVPVIGGPITRFAGEVFPTQAEKARLAWDDEVSDRTNENADRLQQHEQILAPTRTFIGIAAQLIEALARDCPDGLHNRNYQLDELCSLVSDANRQSLEDAAFELQNCGLVEIQRAIGKVWWLSLTQRFYQEVDHQVMGWDTVDDARVVARLMLERNTERVSELYESSGWDRRRFNPALAYVLQFLPEAYIRNERQPTYPKSQVIICPEVRAALRKFLSE